jgi:hypothetical protein
MGHRWVFVEIYHLINNKGGSPKKRMMLICKKKNKLKMMPKMEDIKFGPSTNLVSRRQALTLISGLPRGPRSRCNL